MVYGKRKKKSARRSVRIKIKKTKKRVWVIEDEIASPTEGRFAMTKMKTKDGDKKRGAEAPP